MNYNSNNNVEYVYDDLQTRVSSLVLRVFMWMACGLGITGITAFLTYNSGLFYDIASSSAIFYGLMIAEVALVWFLSARILSLSFATGTILFSIYALLNGLTLSFIFAAYTATSIAQTFFITASMFGVMALYGYFTKSDLSKMKNILLMALIGLIIAGVVNIFLGSGMLSLVISAVGVVVFTLLTAYDTHKIKAMLVQYQDNKEVADKLSILGALSLYLDFINLFLYLLRFLGDRE